MTKIELYDKQFDFVTDPIRRLAFVAGIGSGKTIAGCLKGLTLSDTPGGVGMIAAPTYPMLKDATLRTFLEYADNRIQSFNKSDLIVTLDTGFDVIFRSAENPERLRGPNLSWFYLDEAAMCAEAAWKVGIGRLRQFGVARPAWCTTTPRGRNWVWRRFVKDNQGDHRLIRAHTRENVYIETDFLDDLSRDYVGDYAAQELGGEFVAFEGLVYEEFDRDIHVWHGELPQFDRVIAGVDWGYSNPAVCLCIGIDGDGRAFIFDEVYKRRVRLLEFIAATKVLQATHDIEQFECDPSEPEHIEEMRIAGLTAHPADNAVVSGIQRIKARLAVAGDGRPRLYVTPNCVNVLAEFDSYAWQDKRGYGLLDKPDKVNDHTMDAARYGIAHIDNHHATGRDLIAFVDW